MKKEYCIVILIPGRTGMWETLGAYSDMPKDTGFPYLASAEGKIAELVKQPQFSGTVFSVIPIYTKN